MLGSAAGLMGALAMVAFLAGHPPGGITLTLGALAVFPTLFVEPRVGREFVVANYVGVVLVIVLVVLSAFRGGLVPTMTLWMGLFPVVASMLGGRKRAIIWCCIVLTAVVGIAAAEYAGALPPRTSPPLAGRLLSQAGFVVLSLWLVSRVRWIAVDRQRQLSEQAVAGQKLESLGRLAGGIAHDFNNVLAVVLARVDGALDRAEHSDAARDDLYAIRTAAKRGASLASELVAFSRRGPATYDVLEPAEVVAGAQSVLARLVRESVKIEVEVEPEVPAIEGDRDHLLQVVLNLALNAQDAMPRGGRMSIRLSRTLVNTELDAATGMIPVGAYAVLAVEDEGAGMSAAVQARVFEPFFTTKERGRGSGIGLATVHAIISQHGGHVRVRSEEGKGSTFEVFLPVSDRAETPRGWGDDSDGGGDPASRRVLLVEDDPLVRQALEVVLRRAGHTVVGAADGDEALQRWSEAGEAFDLVLTDVLMPGMTGPALVRTLRVRDPLLRVVYMSGHVEDAMRDVDLQTEQAVFVRKPATRGDLLRAIEQAVAPRLPSSEPAAHSQPPR